MKAVKVEKARRANEEAENEENQASQAIKKALVMRTLGKFGRFLAWQDEEIVLVIMDILPQAVHGPNA